MNIKVYIGVIGSGKTYNSKKDCNVIVSFADALREDMWKMLGWKPKNSKEYEEFKRSKWRLPGDRLYYITGRDLLQRYATEIRRAEDEEHWNKKLIEKIENLRAFKVQPIKIGIDDCRFPNEIKSLIKYCDESGTNLSFAHTDYKSDRYDDFSSHVSEKLAQQFLDFKGTQQEFDFLIKEKYKI